MIRRNLTPLFVVTVIFGVGSSFALAAPKAKVSANQTYKYSMNAMCLLKGKESKPEPFNASEKEVTDSGSSFIKNVPPSTAPAAIQTKFRVASLSKILLTHWAIMELGPLYRFETKVHLSPSETPQGCDIYFEGSSDPFIGKEMLSTVFQQLRETIKAKNICRTIETVSYDENFLVPFNELTKRFVVQHRQDADLRASDPTRFYGTDVTRKALQYFLKTQRIFNVKQEGIGVTTSPVEYQRYLAATPHATFTFKSRPLYMTLREANAFSFNVPPDILFFHKLGGPKAYAEFIKKRLGYGPDQVDMANGSGYPITGETKTYNEVSCSAIVRTIQDLDGVLHSYKGVRPFQLADVMAVGGAEEEFSSFKSLYGESQFSNTLVAKTGSVEEAITFGGMLSTNEGDLYFAVLTRPESFMLKVTDSARMYIRDLITMLADRYTLKKFDYQHQALIAPIDNESQLIDINSDYAQFEQITSLKKAPTKVSKAALP